jgi:hypothetical protein
MTLKTGCVAFSLSLLTPICSIAGEYDREMAQLAAQHDKAVAEATYPITQRYKNALNELLKKAT